MDKQVNNQNNEQDTPFRKFRSAILPINLIEKNSDGSVINKRQIHFQINSGKTYHLSYKFFLPQGCHLAKGSKPVVPCYLGDNGLSVKTLTFVYVKDSDAKEPKPAQDANEAKPVIVNYLNLADKSKIKSGRAYGNLGQTIDILNRIPLPAGYVLCSGQSPMFKISSHFQRVGLLVKKVQPASETVRPHKTQPAGSVSSNRSVSSSRVSSVNSASGSVSRTGASSSHSVQSSGAKESASASSSSVESSRSVESSNSEVKRSVSASSSEDTAASQYVATNSEGTPLPFVQDLQAYRNQLAEQLLNLVHQRDFSFLRKVVAMLLNKSGNNDVSNIQSHPDLHEVSGVAHNQQNHTTYVRARNYDYSRPVDVSEVRDFCTCILDNHADRGIFITASGFTEQARQEAKLHSIVLIDGSKFAHLMIRNRIGVQVKHVYRSFRIDHEFF